MDTDGVFEGSGYLSERIYNECSDRERDMVAREFLYTRNDRRGLEESCEVSVNSESEREGEKKRKREIEWSKERIENDCKSLSKEMLWMCANRIMDEIQNMTSTLCPYSFLEGENSAYWTANCIEWNEIAGDVTREGEEMIRQLGRRIKTWAHNKLIEVFMTIEGNK